MINFNAFNPLKKSLYYQDLAEYANDSRVATADADD